MKIQNNKNIKCEKQIMEKLDRFIRGNNSYVKAYKTYQKWKKKNKRIEQDCTNIIMIFNIDIKRNEKRYNVPT